MKNKLMDVAKLSGAILNVAATRCARDIARDADREMLLTATKRQLHKELVKTDAELIKLVNWGNSFPVREHNELVERRQFISFLLKPARCQGNASYR
jgi:hypothetical protein